MPLSLPLVIVSFFVLDVKVSKDKYLLLFGIIVVSVFSSLLISLLLPRGEENAVNNFKYAIQFISSFSYFFYFKYVSKFINLNLRPLVVIFIFWFLICIGIYLFDPALSVEFMRFIYGKLVKSEVEMFDDLRFSYFFQDPNTAMYFYLVTISIYFSEQKATLSFWLLIFISLVILVLGQSKGNLVALFLMLLSFFYKNKVKSFFNPLNLFVLFFVLVLLTNAFLLYKSLANDNVFIKYSYDRLFSNDEVYMEGGGRFEIWQKFIKNFYPLPLGRGHELIINNQFYSPHNDALRLLYSYGFVAMISVLIFFFGKVKGIFHIIIPALIAFSINTLLDEQKLLVLFLSLLSIELFSGNRVRSKN
jgi:hypothetical protein